MNNLTTVIFKDKKFSDLLEEIYNNQQKRDAQISGLISELKPLIKELGDATLVVPLIKEYLEIGVKNDDQLVKMTTIVQRFLQNSPDTSNIGITDEEKEQLLKEVKNLNKGKNKK